MSHRRLFCGCDENGVLELELDNTGFTTIQACGQQAFYELVVGRVSRARAALDYGAALHAGLEAWQLTNDFSKASDAILTHFSSLPKYDLGWRTSAQAIVTLNAYVERYQKPYKLWQHEGSTYVEHSFRHYLGDVHTNVVLRTIERQQLIDQANDRSGYAPNELYVPINSVRVFFTGRIDLVAELDRRPVPVDYKTCSVDGKAFWDYFQVSPQFTGYLKAVRLHGIDAREFLVDALIARPPTATGVALDFARQSFTRTALQFARWEDDFLYSVKQFVDQLAHKPMRNYTACIGKYGACAFFDVCTMHSEDSANRLLNSSFYAPRTWSPLETA